MALEIFKLVGSIFVDSEAADKSLQKTDKQAEGVGKKLSSGVKSAAKWGAGLVAAAGAVGGAMIASAKSTAEQLDQIDKASQRMGIAAETYQEYAYAADMSGVSVDNLEKAAKKLQGTGYNFDEVMRAIMNLGTEEERMAAASEIFGESVAYSMGPLLASGAEGMEAMRKEAHDLGLVIDNDAVAAGATMGDQFSKLDKSFKQFKTGIMVQVMPFAMQVMDWIIQHMPEIQQTVSSVVESLIPIIEKIMPIIEKVFNFAAALWETTLKPSLDAIITFLNDVFAGNWSAVWEDVVNIFQSIFGGLAQLFREPINWIIRGINRFIDAINSIKIPSWVPGIGGMGFNLGHVAELEKGGVLEKGQTGYLEGNGAEAVVPLEKNKKWISAVANDMEDTGIGGSDEVTSLLRQILDAIEDQHIVVQSVLDGRVIAESVATYNRRKERAFG